MAIQLHQQTELAFDENTLMRFLGRIMQPGECYEVCAIRASYRTTNIITSSDYNVTLASWYDSPQAIVADAAKLKGVSGYFIPNPATRALLARGANKLTKQKHRTTDADITVWRWMLVDIDAKRPADISATDAERQAAMDRIASIHAAHPEIAAASLWGASGNGGWNLVRLPDLPPTAESAGLVARFLRELAVRFDSDAVQVDPKTKNPARLMCLPGTQKCKGVNTPETTRVWRLATLDTPDDHEPTPLDLAAWLARHETPTAPPPPVSRLAVQTPVGSDRDRRIARAGAYLTRIAPAVAGQGGHDQTFDAACALVKGFDLAVHEARPLMLAWNAMCVPPWSDAELEHKLADADAKPDTRPRGYLFDRERDSGGGGVGGETERAALGAALAAGAIVDLGDDIQAPAAPRPLNGAANGHPRAVVAAVEDDGPGLAPDDDSHRLARAYLDAHYALRGGHRLRYYQEEWYEWRQDLGAYLARPKAEIRAEVTGWLHGEFLRLHAVALQRWAATKAGDQRGKKPTLRNVTCAMVANVVQALTSLVVLSVTDVPQAPSWTGPHPWQPEDILPARNVLVHLPSWVEGKPYTLPPTPAYFSTYATCFDFDADAPSPAEWLAFLDQQWANDSASIELLQEWMGYLLTADTSLQKILMLIGPKRSGKGTISRIISAVLGRQNVVNPTLSSLGGRFGLASLVGKPAAIIADARISGRTDTAVVVERLLSISGEDMQTVDRKGKDEVTIKLPTRFLIISNELPKIADTSGAFAGRLLILKMTRSFFGAEDSTLYNRLHAELPGILRWAMDGWRRLRENGRFAQPESSRETMAAMEHLSSPTLAFIAEHIKIGEYESVLCSDVYSRWRTWCQSIGEERTGNEVWFGRNLRAAIPSLTRKRQRTADGLTWVYVGFRLRYPNEISDDADNQEDRRDPNLLSSVPF